MIKYLHTECKLKIFLIHLHFLNIMEGLYCEREDPQDHHQYNT